MKKLKTWVRKLVHKLFPEKLAALYDKAEEVLWYAFFGVLTTAVNFAVYLVMTRLVLKGFFEEHEAAVTLASNWIAWSVAVLFAFFVNKSYVFENKEGGKSLLFQFGSFVLMRLASGVFENFVPTALVEWLHMHDIVAKALVAIVVIIANYFFSKFVAFRRKKNASGGQPEDAVMPHEDSGSDPSESDATAQNTESAEDGRA